ncbi:MAG: carbohydrate ABC transporter substrate-binding protein, partial [Pseudomonadota bacterium]
AQQDRILERLGRHGVLGECGPQLNEERDAQFWLDQPGAPKPRLANEKPQGVTIAYDELIKTWAE